MSEETKELIRAGYQARRQRRPQVAYRDFFIALQQARDEGNTLLLIRALKGLGQIDRDMDHPERALPLYVEAAELCRNLDDPQLLAHTVRHLADIYVDLDELGPAQPFYEEALEIYRSRLDTGVLDLANTVRPQAILKRKTGATDQARTLWEEARMLYKSIGITEGVQEAESELADLRA